MSNPVSPDVLSRLRKQAEIPLVCPISHEVLLALIQCAEIVQAAYVYMSKTDRQRAFQALKKLEAL